MKRLSIIGAGGHGKVVADAAECSGRWEDIVFYDDSWPAHDRNGPWPVIGAIAHFMRAARETSEVIVALGDNRLRAEICTELATCGFRLVNVIHPGATVSRYASIGAGTVVFAGATVNIGARVGPACIINTRATVEHDCLLGEAVHISPGANLAGFVTVGDASWIGIGACVRQQIAIGREVVVGAGAVVIRDLADKVTAVGNPARIIHGG